MVRHLALVGLLALAACSSPEEPAPLKVTWAAGPGCTYDPASGAVEVSLAVSGSGSARVVVTAYADEDTSRPVGSRTSTITSVGGQRVDRLSFPTRRAPYVDVDGVAACSLDVVP